MASTESPAEIIRQLLKLLEQVGNETRETDTAVGMSIAISLVRKLSPQKPDGGETQ